MVNKHYIKYLLVAIISLLSLNTNIVCKAHGELLSGLGNKCSVAAGSSEAYSLSLDKLSFSVTSFKDLKEHTAKYKVIYLKKIKTRYRPGAFQFSYVPLFIPVNELTFFDCHTFCQSDPYADNLYYLSFSLRGPPAFIS